MLQAKRAAAKFVLQPDSFVIVCPLSAVTAMSVFGGHWCNKFPSLDNNETSILKSDNAKQSMLCDMIDLVPE